MNTYELIRNNSVNILHAHKITRAIKHPLRLKMLQLMQEKGKASVTELYVSLRLEQCVCSQHLSVLRNAGIVDTSKDGKFVNYSINQQQVLSVIDAFALLAKK